MAAGAKCINWVKLRKLSYAEKERNEQKRIAVDGDLEEGST